MSATSPPPAPPLREEAFLEAWSAGQLLPRDFAVADVLAKGKDA